MPTRQGKELFRFVFPSMIGHRVKKFCKQLFSLGDLEIKNVKFFSSRFSRNRLISKTERGLANRRSSYCMFVLAAGTYLLLLTWYRLAIYDYRGVWRNHCHLTCMSSAIIGSLIAFTATFVQHELNCLRLLSPV